MADPQTAGAVVGTIVVLATCGLILATLALAACHLWIDLQERLAERRQVRRQTARLRSDRAKWQRLMFDEPDGFPTPPPGRRVGP